MKTLLLDNYDSFSRILFQYLWEINGEQPHFLRNDEMTLEEIRSLDFDNIVISPGPGRPDLARDFGICGAVLAAFPETPVLGVCLGHQGLAQALGARVIAAPAPRHGKTSRILHDGKDLFAGLPQGFSAVRYHSLVVERESLPQGVAVTAKAEDDGQVMGLRLTKRPGYGVQFHPESIGTEWGKRLLYNFKGLSAEWLRGRGAPTPAKRERPTGLVAMTAPARRAGKPMAVKELPWRDPEAVFARLFAQEPVSFWLDSAAQAAQGSGGVFSYMGSGPRLAVPREKDPFDFLENHLRASETWTLPVTSTFRGSFRGGLVGCFGYESAALFLEPDRMLAFDHEAGVVHAMAPESPAGCAWIDSALSAWARLDGPENAGPAPSLLRTGPDPRGLEGFRIPWTAAASKDRYLDSIRALQEAILRGESYEACLTNEIRVAAEADPFLVYRILRRTNPAPYAAFLRFPQAAVLCASPERFLKLDGSGTLSCRPIKGTRRRGATPEEDAALRSELAGSEKERSENLMIVDLMRNDFGHVCALASVRVPESMIVEEHPTVFQLVSEVEGTLAEGVSAVAAVRACFPGGSMTGAPKLRTMELLAAREKRARGIFSGALGYLGSDGKMDLGMVIRTLVWENGAYSVGCGGAILAESDPESEYDEALLKAMAPLRALELAVFGRGGGWEISHPR
jgi:para-aminobenzoate synthetase